jgi:outer membrane receptor for ferrienterochelin and colicins
VHKFESGAKLDAKLSFQYVGADNAMYRTGNGNPARAAARAGQVGRHRARPELDRQVHQRPLRRPRAGLRLGRRLPDRRRRAPRARYPPADVSLPGGDEFYDAKVSRLAVYGQDEWNVTPRWSVYLGARWEGIRTRTEGNTFATVKNNSSVVFSPVAQTLYKLPGTKGDQLRLAVTRTYKAPGQQPDPAPLHLGQQQPDRTRFDRQPEPEAGTGARHRRLLRALLGRGRAAVGQRVEPAASTDYTRNLVSFDGARWVSRADQHGDARAYGLELEAKFPLKAVMQTTTGARPARQPVAQLVDGGLGAGTGQPPDGQTPLSATLGADYKNGRADAGRQLCLQERRLRARLGQPDQLPAVRRDLDLYALWKFNPKLQLRVATATCWPGLRSAESSYTTAAPAPRPAAR